MEFPIDTLYPYELVAHEAGVTAGKTLAQRLVNMFVLSVYLLYSLCLRMLQLALACTQRRSQKVNQATPSLSHSPVKATVPVWTLCMNA